MPGDALVIAILQTIVIDIILASRRTTAENQASGQ